MLQDLYTSQSETTTKEADDPHDDWTEYIGCLYKESSNSSERPSERSNWRKS